MPLDAETKGHLEDVKKGKPRQFVMICKGVKIKSLIVYKKGSVESYKRQAKEEAKGQFYHGVIDGKGTDVRFNLLISDGYEKPPGKELILKDFLKTEAGMLFKPEYQLVDVLPDLNEVEDEDVAEQAPPEATEQGQAPPAAPPPPPTDGPEFTKRLTSLLPQLKQALAANSPLTEQLKTTAAKAQALGKEKKYSEAIPALDELEKLVKTALASASTSAPPSESLGEKGKEKEKEKGKEAGGFSIVNVQSCRLAWDTTRKKLQAELQALEKSIVAAVNEHNEDEEAEDEYEESDVAAGAKNLYTLLDELDTRLIDKLDEALNAEGEARAKLHEQAKEIIKEYQQFVATDPLMNIIDKNPFGDATIRQTVDKTLSVLASKI